MDDVNLIFFLMIKVQESSIISAPLKESRPKSGTCCCGMRGHFTLRYGGCPLGNPDLTIQVIQLAPAQSKKSVLAVAKNKNQAEPPIGIIKAAVLEIEVVIGNNNIRDDIPQRNLVVNPAPRPANTLIEEYNANNHGNNDGRSGSNDKDKR